MWVRGTSVYNILKCGKQMNAINPQIMYKGVPLKPAKLKDLNNLLSKHFMATWKGKENFTFFKTLFEEQEALLYQQVEDEDSDTKLY